MAITNIWSNQAADYNEPQMYYYLGYSLEGRNTTHQSVRFYMKGKMSSNGGWIGTGNTMGLFFVYNYGGTVTNVKFKKNSSTWSCGSTAWRPTDKNDSASFLDNLYTSGNNRWVSKVLSIPVDSSYTSSTYKLKVGVFRTKNSSTPNTSLKSAGRVNERTITINLQAPPSYTITYDLDGGTGDSSSQTAVYNSTVTTHSAPVKTGFTFLSWLGSDGVTYEADTAYVINANITLTAQWSRNSYPLELRGYVSSNGGSSYTYQSNIIDYGTCRVFIDDVPLVGRRNEYNELLPYETAYVFSDIQADTGHTYQGVYSGSTSGTIGAVESGIIVVLQFRTNKYTIAYDLKGGSGTVSPQTKIYNTNLQLSTSIPTKNGYDFLGWDTNSAGTTVVYSSGATLTTDLSSTDGDTVTLYAVWRVSAPTNVRFITAEATGPFNINLVWTCTGLNITNYTIYYKKSTASAYIPFDCGTSTSLALTVDPETIYNIYVKATNDGGSAVSSIINVTTPADQAKIRIYNGSSWLQGKTYIYNGNTWVKAKKVYIYDGSVWKINSNN